MFDRLRYYLKRSRTLRSIYRKLRYPHGFPEKPLPPAEWRMREVDDFRPRRTENFKDGLRLNLLIPTALQDHIFGGISTALRFFEELADQMGVPRRVIATDVVDPDGDMAAFGRYALRGCWKDTGEDRQLVMYSYDDRVKDTIPVAEGDVFVATAWWTAYDLFPVLRWQAEAYGIPVRKMVYVVQDFEPGFYPWGSRYVMAERTYTTDLPIVAVYNTGILRDYFHSRGYRFYREACFEPTLNPGLRDWLVRHPGPMRKKKQILIYGRPFSARNAFGLIMTALREWARTQPGAAGWSVVSAGERFPDVDVGSGVVVRCAGKLTLEQYARTMADSYLGVSIMVSPHPSYPPLEMSTFGVKTITNCYANKDLSGFNANIVSLRHYSPRDIAAEMRRLCAAYSPGAAVGRNDGYLRESDAFKGVCGQVRAQLLEG